jgi:hypothetical protein
MTVGVRVHFVGEILYRQTPHCPCKEKRLQPPRYEV